MADTLTSSPKMRASVLAARQRLADARAKLRRQHEADSPGIQVCSLLTDQLDLVILEIWKSALADLRGSAGDGEWIDGQVALIAHGGFGRREMAPFSDVDLMLLHDHVPEAQILPLAQRLTMDICDAGLDLGFSVRSKWEVADLAYGDAKIFTSLADSRFLAGNEELYKEYFQTFRGFAKANQSVLLASLAAAREEERSQFGETVYLLEPNIKRSRGALRDLQLIRWVGFAAHGETDPENLARASAISKKDQQRLLQAKEFLLRVRNELHFAAGKSADALDRSEQMRIAERFGYRGRPEMLAVEEFMREYFDHTSSVWDVAAHFLRSCKPGSIFDFLEPLLSHQVEGDFRVGPTYIRATNQGLEKVTGDVAQVLRLMDLANLYDRRIDDSTWKAIREAMMERETIEVPPETYDRFLSLLSQPPRLGELLRQLHELRVLDKIVPGMQHARCLLQFNQYHQFTVDEHCLRAVECAANFFNDKGPLGQAYRSVKRKRTLHLALLLHDLGKGFLEDHSEVGLRLAAETAENFQLPPRESEKLKFLVHKHLLFNEVAFKKDSGDERLIVQLAVECGTPDVAKMLYVMSCADLAAVGPGVFNQWKLEVLTDLYHRVMYHLAGDADSPASKERLQKCRDDLVKLAGGTEAEPWFRKQVDAMPPVYLRKDRPEHLAAELKRLKELGPRDALVWGRWLPELQAVEYTLGVYESSALGIFHRATGSLAAQGMQILSAEIHTLANGLAWDRFYVQDLDYAGQPPADRLEEVSQKLVAALKDQSNQPPRFRRLWQAKSGTAANLNLLETKVRIDTSTSDRYTEFAVFTYDRIGILYTISRTLFELDLSVQVAKIGTHLDQVVDVFYVTDRSGAKIVDEGRIEHIRTTLLAAMDENGK